MDLHMAYSHMEIRLKLQRIEKLQIFRVRLDHFMFLITIFIYKQIFRANKQTW